MHGDDGLFESERPRLTRLAYRMLGSLADADDVLQEAYLRFAREDRSAVKSPRAYLTSIVVRLCIDARRKVEARKEGYIGPWLPEPIVEAADADPTERAEAAESISLALLIVLESLSPVERAAFLLRRVFDYGYGEISDILNKSAPNCRQIVHRAEQSIHEHRPRSDADPREAERITGAFFDACGTGDLAGLMQLLSDDVVVYSDGGGKVTAARAPVHGADRVARFFLGVIKKSPPDIEYRRVRVNGQPGVMALAGGRVVTVLTLDIVDGRVAECFVVRNPDKLARIAAGN